jgi:hypothetical protein
MQMDSIEEAFEKMDGPITEMIQRLTAGARSAQRTQRPGGGVGATGIGIEVSTSVGGTLYFQDEEAALLWDNDTYTIPIERPGTYTVRLVLADGSSQIRTVAITARGITKVNFKRIEIGDPGPGGGIVFFAEGERYIEVSEILGAHTWSDALSVARNYRGGGYSDWRLPTKDELNLIYQNLRAKQIGSLGDIVYWSSSEYVSSDAWAQRFSDGLQDYNPKALTYSVRAVRAF